MSFSTLAVFFIMAESRTMGKKTQQALNLIFNKSNHSAANCDSSVSSIRQYTFGRQVDVSDKTSLQIHIGDVNQSSRQRSRRKTSLGTPAEDDDMERRGDLPCCPCPEKNEYSPEHNTAEENEATYFVGDLR